MTLQDHLEQVLSVFVRFFEIGANWLSREFPAIADISDFVLVALLILVSWIIRNILLAIADRSAGFTRFLCLFLGYTIGLPAILLVILISWARVINLSANQGNPSGSPTTSQVRSSDPSSMSNSQSMPTSIDIQPTSISIQILNGTIWNTQTVIQDETNIPFFLRSVKEQYPDHRVRAVDANGRVLDLVP